MLREWGKRMIIGMPWESAIRRAHVALTGSKSSRYDHQTIEIMRRVLRRDSVAVDIGAHQGGMLRHIVRFAPNAEHIAVEPLPKLAGALRAAFPRCRIVHAALSDRVGTMTFQHVTRHPAMSGLRRRVDLPAGEEIQEISVPVDTLDRVVPPTTKVDFIKMDVEGGEGGVIRGGRETLRRCRPVVVFEFGLGGADSYGTRPGDVHGMLAECGLDVYLLEDWLGGSAPLGSEEFARQFDEGLNYYFVAAPRPPESHAGA